MFSSSVGPSESSPLSEMSSSISVSMRSRSSSESPIFSIMFSTGLIPSSFAQRRQMPSFTVFSPSKRVTNTTAMRFLHLEQSSIFI